MTETHVGYHHCAGFFTLIWRLTETVMVLALAFFVLDGESYIDKINTPLHRN
jgi:hypothetical protein